MAELRRDDHGTWTLRVDEAERANRNEAHDEALPRYLTAFDPAFAQAEEACESEFVKALIRVASVQDAGWDPYDTTLRTIPAMIALHDSIPDTDEYFETARHLQLWMYGHIIEASEPYAILADMLDIAGGGVFRPYRFPAIPLARARPGQLFPPSRPQFFREKLPELERLANAIRMPTVLDPVREVWDFELRNAVFHADYSLHGGEVRLPGGQRYSHGEVQILVNRAIAYHEGLALLVREHRRGYREPKRVPVHAELAREQDEAMVVMVREGTGAIGLRYVYSQDEVAAGAIPAHIARLYPDEVEAVQADPTLVMLPARPM